MVATGFRLVLKFVALVGHCGAVVYLVTAEIVCVPAALPAVTVICFDPCPAVIVHPEGTVQKYSVAPPTGIVGGSAAMEKITPV
jgi:hypothetical protein